MNILLVEDDYLLAKGTAKLIQRLGGHSVRISDVPVEIFRCCQAREVDIVIMDVNLPGAEWLNQEVSGADIARLLKTQPQTARIPIVLVTAYAMLSERRTLMVTSLADAFCTKPVTDYKALLQLVNRLIMSKG